MFGWRPGKPAWARHHIQAVDFVGLGLGSLPGGSCLVQGCIQTDPSCMVTLIMVMGAAREQIVIGSLWATAANNPLYSAGFGW